MAAIVQILTPIPRPEADEVHIHCVTLASGTARYVTLDELHRAGRLLDPLKRDRFLACRGLLREILGRYLGMQPQALYITEGEHGKPHLHDESSDSTRLHFNLSHSGATFLLAIATDREVGIDVERVRQDTPFTDMARLAFSPQEQAELLDLPVHLQRSAFYRCWTRKEAYLKACGVGFDLPSNNFNVSLLPAASVSMLAPYDNSDWLLHDITVPEDYSAALAVKGSFPIIRYIV